MNQIARMSPRTLHARPAAVRKRREPTNLRLWLPITPIALLLAPFAMLAVPVVAATDVLRKTTIAAYMINATRLALSMRGTEVAVRSRKGSVHIWIF